MENKDDLPQFTFRFTSNKSTDFENLVRLVETNPEIVNIKNGICRKSLLHLSIENQRTEMVNFLLEKGSRQLYDINGNRPLHIACLSGNKEILEILINYGADVEWSNLDGDKPIHLASACENVEVLVTLLSAGADMMSRGANGNYALHAAAFNPNVSVLKELLARGFDTTVLNDNEDTALHIAAGASRFDSREHIEALTIAGAMLDSRYFNSAIGHTEEYI